MSLRRVQPYVRSLAPVRLHPEEVHPDGRPLQLGLLFTLCGCLSPTGIVGHLRTDAMRSQRK